MSGKRFDYGDVLHLQIRALHLPEPMREFTFAPPRRWRFDLCWPDRLLYVECQGGEHVHGSRRHGGSTDCEKQNAAVLAGWTPLVVTGSQVKNGAAVALLEQVFAAGGPS